MHYYTLLLNKLNPKKALDPAVIPTTIIKDNAESLTHNETMVLNMKTHTFA